MNNTQLERWSEEFGEAYTRRNVELNFSPQVKSSTKELFCEVMGNTNGIQKIIEVGCNTGHNFLVLSEIGNFELVGIDPQASALKIGKEKGVTATLMRGSVYEIPFYDGYFDMAMTLGVLMHIDRRDISNALKEIDRVANRYFLTVDYFEEREVAVSYHGYGDMLWRRDMRKICHEILPHMRHIWEKRLAQDPSTGKYTWGFLFEK